MDFVLLYCLFKVQQSLLPFLSHLPRQLMQWGAFSLSHRLLGLDFPTNLQATGFSQTVSECSSANGLHSRDLSEDGGQGVCVCACAWVEEILSQKNPK